MAETVNLSKAASLLGISLPTARRRISPSYKGKDRIRGAVKKGRSWRIPGSEVHRHAQLRAKELDRVLSSKQAYNAAFDIVGDLETTAQERLEDAAKAFVKALGPDGDYDDPAYEALGELRTALRNVDALNEASAIIVDAIAGRLEHRKRRRTLFVFGGDDK